MNSKQTPPICEYGLGRTLTPPMGTFNPVIRNSSPLSIITYSTAQVLAARMLPWPEGAQNAIYNKNGKLCPLVGRTRLYIHLEGHTYEYEFAIAAPRVTKEFDPYAIDVLFGSDIIYHIQKIAKQESHAEQRFLFLFARDLEFYVPQGHKSKAPPRFGIGAVP